MLYFQDYVKNECAKAGFHCTLNGKEKNQWFSIKIVGSVYRGGSCANLIPNEVQTRALLRVRRNIDFPRNSHGLGSRAEGLLLG